MKILIVTGGSSSERKISLISAKNVKEALEKIGHSVSLFDLKKGLASLKKIVKNFDVVFPVLHGEEGEGGSLQQNLSKLKVPYVGGDPKGFREGWFKVSFKKWCEKNNITSSPWKKIKNVKDVLKFGFPSVLKSTNGGSSKEVVILKSEEDLKSTFTKNLLESRDELFVERFLPGVEITVAVLNDKALPIIEIIPPKGAWFDYKNKYSGGTKEIPNAPSVSGSIQKQAQEVAEQIHKKLRLGQYCRIDFIISDGKPYVLEINTIPGLTSESLFPKAAKAVRISFPELMDRLVKLAYGSKISKA